MNPHFCFATDFTPDPFPGTTLPFIQDWDQHWPEAGRSVTFKANVLTAVTTTQ